MKNCTKYVSAIKISDIAGTPNVVLSKHYYNLKPRWHYPSFCYVYRSLKKVSRRELCTSIINPFLFLRRKWFLAFGRTHYACRGSSLSRRRRLYALGWWFDVTYLGWRGLRLWGDRCWWGRGGFLRLVIIFIIVIFIIIIIIVIFVTSSAAFSYTFMLEVS